MQSEENIKVLIREIIMEIGGLQAQISNLEKQFKEQGKRFNSNCDYIQSRYQRIHCLEFARKKLEWVVGI